MTKYSKMLKQKVENKHFEKLKISLCTKEMHFKAISMSEYQWKDWHTTESRILETAFLDLRRISSHRRNHSKRLSKYSPARRTISGHCISMTI